jgi:hypothetical protein
VEVIEAGRSLLVELMLSPMPEHVKILESLQQFGNPYHEAASKRLNWFQELRKEFKTGCRVVPEEVVLGRTYFSMASFRRTPSSWRAVEIGREIGKLAVEQTQERAEGLLVAAVGGGGNQQHMSGAVFCHAPQELEALLSPAPHTAGQHQVFIPVWR